MEKRVGEFTLDMETGDITGPKGYMESDEYRKRINAIEDGTDLLAWGPYASRDMGTAILVSIQTDYAAWRGKQDLLACK